MVRRSTTSPAALARLERVRAAVLLRASGMPYAQIAAECGFPSPKAAMMAVRRFMAKESRAVRDEARAIHRERLETLLRSLWLAATNPALAQKAARDAGHPKPPSQDRAIELLIRLLDQEARADGLYTVRAEVSGPEGGPIEGRLDVMHWVPDDAFLARYVRVLQEAGLFDDEEEEPRFLGPDGPATELE